VAAATTALALIGASAGGASADTVPLPTVGSTRIAGATRFETAVKVSKKYLRSASGWGDHRIRLRGYAAWVRRVAGADRYITVA
jgi:hypothetical protein